MKAILLSAGLGKRLQPVTLTTPKCLVRINDKPMLQHWIEKLVPLGVTEFLINTHYMSDEVENFFNVYQAPANIKLVHETNLLGTAGTILRNASFVDRDCFIAHTDTFIEDNLTDFLAFHDLEQISLYSAVGFSVKNPTLYGTFVLDDSNSVIDFIEKDASSPSRIASAACFIVRPAFLRWMRDTTPLARDLSIDTLTKARGLGRVYRTSKAVFDIGSIENLSACDRYVRTSTNSPG